MSTPPKKRLPGQSDAEYTGGRDPNIAFLGVQSQHGGGDGFSWLFDRLLRAWSDRRDRKRRR